MLMALFVGLCGAGAFGAIGLLANRGRGRLAVRPAAHRGVVAALALIFSLALAPVAFLEIAGPDRVDLFPVVMVALLFGGGLLVPTDDAPGGMHKPGKRNTGGNPPAAASDRAPGARP